jgi:hypothetical protein
MQQTAASQMEETAITRSERTASSSMFIAFSRTLESIKLKDQPHWLQAATKSSVLRLADDG